MSACQRFSRFSAAQRGFSVWILLPWLLFLVLAFVFWWFVQTRPDALPAQDDPSPAPAVHAPALATAAEPVASYRDAVEAAADSVVNIYTTKRLRGFDDPMVRQFLQYHGYDLPQNGQSNLGSGVVVSADGYIVTNAHVIGGADEIVVAFADGSKKSARVIGADDESDLAVIKVEADNLKPVIFRATDVAVGDVVLAIGNPFGVGQTVTQGIVSATGRTGFGMNTFEDFIQTDAAINPGNSGGALVDTQGQLVGINTMIYSRSGGSMGIGFAIKAQAAQKAMQDIVQTGSVRRGWLGVGVDRQVADPSRLNSPQGVLVSYVIEGSPAEEAGIKAGDAITAVDDVAYNDANALIAAIAQKEPDSILRLDIQRGDRAMRFEVRLARRPNFTQNQNR